MGVKNKGVLHFFLYGVLVLFLPSCYNRKFHAPTFSHQPNSSPLEPKATHPKIQNSMKWEPENPRLGNTQYLNFVEDYIETYSSLAIKEMHQYGVPASIILAQGIHESGAGKSSLAVQANNHFGVKCTSDWTGPGYYMKDDRPNECFRKYANPEQSFEDHMAFLQRKRYSSLYALDPRDFRAWAAGLKASGYATNPNYPQILISLIQRYNLNQFDSENLSKPLAPNPDHSILVGNSSIPGQNQPIRYVVDTIYTFAYKNQRADTPQIKNEEVNNMVFYKIRQGDTLYNISKRFNLSPDQIKQINNLSDSGIKIDQVIRIKP